MQINKKACQLFVVVCHAGCMGCGSWATFHIDVYMVLLTHKQELGYTTHLDNNTLTESLQDPVKQYFIISEYFGNTSDILYCAQR